MKTLYRNKRKLYYRQLSTSVAETDANGNETGCYVDTFGDWTGLLANYSSGSNSVELREHGLSTDTDRQIVFAKGDCPLLATSQIYIGSETPTSATNPNYRVSGIDDSLNYVIVSIKEVDVN